MSNENKKDAFNIDEFMSGIEIDTSYFMRLETLRHSGLALKNMKEQTDEMCLIAVGQDGLALEYVKKQSDEICLSAVRQNGSALEFVENQTNKICKAAVKQSGLALKHVKTQTKEICLAAVKSNGMALQFVEKQTEEICLAAVTQVGNVLFCVEEQTEEICLAAVRNDGGCIMYVKNQTEEMCLIAVKESWTNIRYVKEQTDNICTAVVTQNPISFTSIEPKHFTYNAEIIKACYASLKESWSGISKGPVGLYKKFYDKLSVVLGDLDEEELVNAVDVELKHIFNDDVINHHDGMFNIKQKVSMLKSSFDGKINTVDKKPKII